MYTYNWYGKKRPVQKIQHPKVSGLASSSGVAHPLLQRRSHIFVAMPGDFQLVHGGTPSYRWMVRKIPSI